MKSVGDVLKKCNINDSYEYYKALYDTYYHNAMQTLKDCDKLREHKKSHHARSYAIRKLEEFVEMYRK